MDTVYDWPTKILSDIAGTYPGVQYFNSFNGKDLAAKRQRDGWKFVRMIDVPAVKTNLPNVFLNFSHHLIIYTR